MTRHRPAGRWHGGIALGLLGSALLLAACGGPPQSALGAGPLRVVAAENVWGSIAAQLGGGRVSVASIVSDPNADPHEYESSTQDARAFADAGLVLLNGAGYDDWGQKLLDANPADDRTVLNVAAMIGKKPGDNPHFWYSALYVAQVADRITAAYQRMLPAESDTFAALRHTFDQALQPYRTLIAGIGARFAGRRVGATEDIVVYLAAALRLDLVSPPAFMRAVAEGTDPPAGAVAAFTDQLQSRGVAVLVFNTQTVTSVTTSMRQLAKARQIPEAGMSETIQPPTSTYQAWQVAQLQQLERALASSTAR